MAEALEVFEGEIIFLVLDARFNAANESLFGGGAA